MQGKEIHLHFFVHSTNTSFLSIYPHLLLFFLFFSHIQQPLMFSWVQRLYIFIIFFVSSSGKKRRRVCWVKLIYAYDEYMYVCISGSSEVVFYCTLFIIIVFLKIVAIVQKYILLKISCRISPRICDGIIIMARAGSWNRKKLIIWNAYKILVESSYISKYFGMLLLRNLQSKIMK